MAKLNPYLNFKDSAKEAMEFYKTVFGGTLTMSTFGESHVFEDPSEAEKIMHAQLEGDNDIVFMAADTPNSMKWPEESNISMSLSGGAEDEELLRGYWNKLVEGGTQVMPLEKAPWGDTFGMLTDKFGTKWLVNIAGKKE